MSNAAHLPRHPNRSNLHLSTVQSRKIALISHVEGYYLSNIDNKMNQDVPQISIPENPKKPNLLKWIILTIMMVGMFGMYFPADISQGHLNWYHAYWNGKPMPTPQEEVEGAIEDLVVGRDDGGREGKDETVSDDGDSYDEAIREKKDLIQKIDKSFKQFQCLPIDPLFHYFFPEPINEMHFATYDEVLVPSCQTGPDFKWSGDRQNIAVWNRRRTVTEWALHALLTNDNVLYFRPGVFNHVELITISQQVGPSGRIYVLGYEKGRKCFEQTQKANEILNNVHFIAAEELPNVGYLNALIAHELIFKDGPISVYPVPAFKKMLLFCEQGKETAQIFPSFKVEKVLLRDKPCGTAVFTTGKGRGFFSFTSSGVPTERRVLSKQPSTKIISKQYDKFKLANKERITAELATLEKYSALDICHPSQQTEKGVRTVYGNQLIGATLKDLQSWEDRRQPIEWARKLELKGDIYYEMSTFNLLVIFELSLLLESHKMFVVCAECCDRIKKNERANMVLLPVSDSNVALKAAAIITDNSTLIRQSINEGFLQRGALLTFLAGENGLFLLRQLFVAHNLREVILPKQKGLCLGFTYLHSFWNSEEPNGFYDVSPSKLGYVAYAFWGGDPHKVYERKKFLMQEMSSGSVQLKIVGPKSFRFFQVQGSPIHPAFYLLSTGHQSDYFRTYVMHHYGGIYLDIKHIHIDLNDYFKKLQSSDKIFITGFPDHGLGACNQRGARPTCWIAHALHKRLLANIQFAAKKGTGLTRQWLRELNTNLDTIYDQLKRNPSQVDRQSRGAHLFRKDGHRFISRYPIEWSQVAGEALIRPEVKYLDNIDQTMPRAITIDYIKQ